MQDHGLSWNPSRPDIWYSTGKSFLRSQPGPCMLQHKLPLFCLQQRQESSSTCLRFHWRLLLCCPSDVCSPGFKHAQLPQVFSWTLLINQRMSSTDGFPLCLTLPFKLDSKSKARYSCKEGTGSFGWTCFVSKAAEYQGAFARLVFSYSTFPWRSCCPQCATMNPTRAAPVSDVRVILFAGASLGSLLFGCATWKTNGSVDQHPFKGEPCIVVRHPFVPLSGPGTVLGIRTKATVPAHRECRSLLGEISAQLPNHGDRTGTGTFTNHRNIGEGVRESTLEWGSD